MRSKSKSDSLTAFAKLVPGVCIGFSHVLAEMTTVGLAGVGAVATAGAVVAFLLWLCFQFVQRLNS